MADTTYAQAEGYWIAAGGDSSVAPIMAAIAEAESSLDSTIIQSGQPYSTTGYGLWQITPGDSEPQCGSDTGLLNGSANACAAVAKYNQGGLTQWTTYTSGAYKAYMNGSTTPDMNGTTSTGASTSSAVAPPTNADTLSSGCAFGIPSISIPGLSSIPLIGGAFSTPEICLFKDSWLRALLGATLIAAGGIVSGVAIAVLVKSMVHGNTGLKSAPGAVTGLLHKPSAGVAQTTDSAGNIIAAPTGGKSLAARPVSSGSGSAPRGGSASLPKGFSAPKSLPGTGASPAKHAAKSAGGKGIKGAIAGQLTLGEAVEALPEVLLA